MLFISVTNAVFHEEIFPLKEEASLNMDSILVTETVFQEDKFPLKEEASLNI